MTNSEILDRLPALLKKCKENTEFMMLNAYHIQAQIDALEVLKGKKIHGK